MQIARAPHRWKLTPSAAIALQSRLAGQVRICSVQRRIRSVAGADCAFSSDGRHCLAAVVLWEVETGRVVETHRVCRPLRFPYVPGLLSFREAPALLDALRALRRRPDAIMCDGQGLAHPRRFGIACHVGVLCDVPTLGVAKSRLVGEYAELADAAGSSAPLLHTGERVGSVLRTRTGVRPVFVSVGHRMDLASAERLVRRTCAGHRLPEPTRHADRAVSEYKRSRSRSGRASRPGTHATS